MGDYPGIYRGANYGFEREDTFEPLIPSKYRINPGQFGITTDPRSANQLKEVSDKFNTGAKTVEVSGISTEVLESVPDQHLMEIARLKKLAGADITFHGPLVEPTGINQQGWEESSRVQAERQIWDAVKRGQQMMIENVSDVEKGKKAKYKDENLVITLHTSNGLMSPRTDIKDAKTGEIKLANLAVIDEYSGKAGNLPAHMLAPDKFEDGEKAKAPTPEEAISKINEKFWNRDLNNVSIEVMRGRDAIQKALLAPKKDEDEEIFTKEITKIKDMFKLYHENPTLYQRSLEAIDDPTMKAIVDSRITTLAHGEGFIHDSYDAMKEMYTKAKEALRIEQQRTTDENKRIEAQKALEQLENYRKGVADTLKKYKEDPLKIKEFGEEVERGIRLLQTLPTAPPQYRLLEEFAVDKASDTFAGVAANAYKEFGQSAPILSLENPPVGMGLTRADEIEKLVKESRRKLSAKLQFDNGLDKKEAEKTAEKLIGVTWDVGHINMIKKYGFDDKDLAEQTRKITPYLKHVHLSDNFGLEHTELPMGMGNVPMKEHLAVIGDKIKGMKAIIETGGHWYQDFKTSPLPETLSAFGSPLYPMQMQPTWDAAQAMTQRSGYFSGYGMNPDVHHSIYGAGFAGLPTELGGSIAGRGNRLSGAPME